MIDLKNISGLPIFLDEKNLELELRGDFPSVKKSARTLAELEPYLKTPGVGSGPDPAYRMWREVHLKSDDQNIGAQNLRYDLTLLAPGKINGEEFVKTAGHFHEIKTGTGLGYPEIYEVISGRGYFLLQKMDEIYSQAEEVYLIESAPKEKVLVPPGFGHATINVYDEPLLVANWVGTTMSYNYEPYKKHRGAAYYLIGNEAGGIDILKNSNYGDVPEIKKIRARELPKFGLIESRPMYELAKDLNKLKFLNYPEEFVQDININAVYRF